MGTLTERERERKREREGERELPYSFPPRTPTVAPSLHSVLQPACSLALVRELSLSVLQHRSSMGRWVAEREEDSSAGPVALKGGCGGLLLSFQGVFSGLAQ